jgi:hypothetical protein
MRFDLSQIQVSGSCGLDAMLAESPEIISPHKSRRKVASLRDLSGFVRVSSDTLVHKSQRDLWSLKKEGDEYFVERLFDDSNAPLKG